MIKLIRFDEVREGETFELYVNTVELKKRGSTNHSQVNIPLFPATYVYVNRGTYEDLKVGQFFKSNKTGTIFLKSAAGAVCIDGNNLNIGDVTLDECSSHLNDITVVENPFK